MNDNTRLGQARQYAAGVRQRNAIAQPPCACTACQQAVMLPAVLRVLAAESHRQKNLRRRTNAAAHQK